MFFRKIDNVIKIQISLFFQRNHWRFDVVVQQTLCYTIIAYKWESNLQKYDNIKRFHFQEINRSRRIITLIKKNMLKFQRSHFWIYHDELTIFFEKKWNIKIYKKTMCNILRKKEINRKKKQRIEFRNDFLRNVWQIEMKTTFTTKQLICINEFLFKIQID